MAIPTNVETTFLLGRLNWDAIPKEPIVMATFVVVAPVGASTVVAASCAGLARATPASWRTAAGR